MTKLAPSIKSQRLQSIFTIATLGSQFTQTSINIIVHKYKTIKFDLVGKRPAKMHILDCLQSAFSLKIRLVLISSSSIANHDVIITIRDPRFSRLAALPLVCLGFACSDFAKKNKRLLAVYAYPNQLNKLKRVVENFTPSSHRPCFFEAPQIERRELFDFPTTIFGFPI